MRKIAFRPMWRYAKFDATDENFERNFLNLDQLSLELDPGNLADLSPRLYLQTLEIDIRFVTKYHEDARPSSSEYETISEEYDYLAYNRIRHHKAHIDEARDAGCWDDIEMFVQKCLAPLRNCSGLYKIIWRSPLVLPIAVMNDLKLLPGLQTLHLDFQTTTISGCTHQWSEHDWNYRRSMDAKRVKREDGLLPKRGGNLSLSLIIDASKPHGRYRPSDGLSCDKLASSDDEAGVTFAKSLTLCRSLYVDAPDLLHQRWMVPVWAQVDDLAIRTSTGGHVQKEDPFATAALRFRSLLQQSGALAAEDAHHVFQLIHSHEALAAWKAWFPTWPSGEAKENTPLSTNSLLSEALRRAQGL